MRKLSYVLIAILLSSFVNLLPVNSQPNACININNIKTPELIAQFETWLNEPDGLNTRFIDKTESSFERGQRLFYDLVLNNNQICLSDLTQEMIDSITEVISSYDNAIDHNYSIDGLTVTRSEINLALKSIRDPIILFNPSIFAEARQIANPIADIDSLTHNSWENESNIDCNLSTTQCWIQLIVNSPFNRTRNDSPEASEQIFVNLTSLIDPVTNSGFIMNYTSCKSASGGRQIDSNTSLLQDLTIIQSHFFVNHDECFFNVGADRTFTITDANASSITDFTNLNVAANAFSVGGGAVRFYLFYSVDLSIPDPPPGPFDIQTALPIATISQMLFQVHGGTSGGLHHFVLQEEFQSHNSFSNWIEVFRDDNIIRLRLCALPTPVSRNATNHIIRFTALSRGTGVVERLSIHILNSTQDIIQEFPETDISRTDFTTHNFTLTQANADAIDDYSLIFIELHATNLGVNDDESIFITQAQLDIPETDLTVVCIPEAEVLGTSELFPLAPLMNLFFIIGGFLLVFNAKGRLEFQASGMFFFLASLLFIISPIYAVLDSNNVLSYVILNYPDSIRNNFVLINFVFIGLGLTSVIINNKGRLGFKN